MTCSFFSCGSEPSSLATTFLESTARILFEIVKLAFASSVTGLKSFLSADCLSVAKSCPACLKNSCALLSVIQLCTGTRFAFSSERKSKFSRAWLEMSTK